MANAVKLHWHHCWRGPQGLISSICDRFIFEYLKAIIDHNKIRVMSARKGSFR